MINILKISVKKIRIEAKECKVDDKICQEEKPKPDETVHILDCWRGGRVKFF